MSDATLDEKRLSSHSPSASASFRHSHSHSQQPGRPTTPHTPPHQLRSTNSSFASTTSAGSSLRGEEDAIVFEFGSRWLRAGFEGRSAPMCVVGCGPEQCRRAGDYRGWLRTTLDELAERQRPKDPEEWAAPYELWKMDLRTVDLGLVEDKIERMVRETYHTYLLTDAGTMRLVLVLPSVMPYPLLSSVLSTLFSRWRFPSITLLPTPAMATMAAGLRSALVVDLGWAESTVTGVYEYREIGTKRSTRAMKALLQETGRLLTGVCTNGADSKPAQEIAVGFEFCEEVVSRFMWARPQADMKEEEGQSHEDSVLQKPVSIPSPYNPATYVDDIPFSRFSEPVEKVLFADGLADRELDDDEKPLPLLVYNTLLSLPPDARGVCMSRVVFIGGGSRIPGLRHRVLKEVGALIEKYGWNPVRGKVIDEQIQKLQSLRLSKSTPASSDSHASSKGQHEQNKAPEQKQEDEIEIEIDPIEQKLHRHKDKDSKPPVQGVLREVESLGPWAGASLAASLKTRGMVEIEREKYLMHGLAGASRELEHGHHGHGHGDRRSGLRSGGDRSSWTLAGWA